MLRGKALDIFGFRKTCGAGRRSDEAGGCLKDDFTAGSLHALTYGLAGYIVALAKNDDFFTIQHLSLLTVYL